MIPLFLLSLLAQQQAEEPALGSICVVRSTTGDPASRAYLDLLRVSPPTSSRRLLSADDGTFAFPDLSPGSYQLTVRQSGFATRRLETLLTVAPGENVTGIVAELSPQAVITGMVTDPAGDPVPGAPVQVLERVYERGVRALLPRAPIAIADDRGVYRIAEIPPGRYYVRATLSLAERRIGSQVPPSSGSPQPVIVDTLYPGATTERSATLVEVTEGTELTGVDIRLQRELRYTIRGRVIDRAGDPMERLPLTIQPRRALGVVDVEQTLRDTRSSRDGDGGFEFHGLAPGNYIVRAAATARNSSIWGRADITIGSGDVNDIVIRTGPGAEITGAVTVEEGDSLPPMSVLLSEEIGAGGGAQPVDTSDGTFLFESVLPGRYRVDFRDMPEGYYIQSIRFGDADITHSLLDLTNGEGGTLDIVLSPLGAEITGTVNAPPLSKGGSRVLLWPRTPDPSRSLSGLRSVPTDQTGGFRFTGIEPGEYFLTAWEASPLLLHSYFDFVNRFADSALRLDIAEDASLTVDPPVIPAIRIAEEAEKLP